MENVKYMPCGFFLKTVSFFSIYSIPEYTLEMNTVLKAKGSHKVQTRLGERPISRITHTP